MFSPHFCFSLSNLNTGKIHHQRGWPFGQNLLWNLYRPWSSISLSTPSTSMMKRWPTHVHSVCFDFRVYADHCRNIRELRELHSKHACIIKACWARTIICYVLLHKWRIYVWNWNNYWRLSPTKMRKEWRSIWRRSEEKIKWVVIGVSD